MEYDKIAFAIKLCGSTPKVDQCKECPYWAGGDMSKCIPTMTKDAFAAIIYLMVENQSLRNAANHTDAWNARCESCDRDRNDFRPDFKWRGEGDNHDYDAK